MKQIAFLSTALFFFVASNAAAQWVIGPQVVIATPEPEFANIQGTGGGFGIKAIRKTELLGGSLGWRGDFAFLTFGKDRQLDLFGNSIEARNEGYRLSVGPEFSVGTRKLRAYAGANAGLYYFRVNIRTVFDYGYDEYFRQRDNNWALGWNFGLGLQYDVGLGPWLDVGFEYQTMHNLPESLPDRIDPEVEPPPIPDITAHEFTFKVGVTFFLGR